MRKRFSVAHPWLVCAIGGLVAACSEPPTRPSAPPPAPLPPGPAPVTFTLSGTVFDHTPAGARPLPGLRLRVLDRHNPFAFVVSDEQGRYAVSGLPANAVVVIGPAIETPYRAPCPAGTDDPTRAPTLDLHVVSTALLAVAPLPRSLPRSVLGVEGTVIERTAEGSQTLQGAVAELADTEFDPSAESVTVTDVAGRYLLCTAPPGVGADQFAYVRASKPGYHTAVERVFLAYGIDEVTIELVRR